VADNDSGLQIINVKDPANPNLVGSHKTPGQAWGVYIKDSLAYVADEHNGLIIINVKDPANPDSVGSYATPGWAEGVFVQDSLAYVADGPSGLEIFNVSNPAHPILVASYNTLGRSFNVFAKGEYVYVADQQSLMIFKFTYGTEVKEVGEGKSLPSDFSLFQNYPNPFNPSTTIPFSVSYKGQGAGVKSPIRTTLTIYNILGQRVRTLVDEDKFAGEYKVFWDGKDGQGKDVASGIYFYKLKEGDLKETKRMVLLK
jgi:hypothetical protein